MFDNYEYLLDSLINDTLEHKGVKGMKWKNHVYKTYQKGVKSIHNAERILRRKLSRLFKKSASTNRRELDKYIAKVKQDKRLEEELKRARRKKAISDYEAERARKRSKWTSKLGEKKRTWNSVKNEYNDRLEAKRDVRKYNNWVEQDLNKNGLRGHMNNVRTNDANSKKARKDFASSLVKKSTKFIRSHS